MSFSFGLRPHSLYFILFLSVGFMVGARCDAIDCVYWIDNLCTQDSSDGRGKQVKSVFKKLKYILWLLGDDTYPYYVNGRYSCQAGFSSDGKYTSAFILSVLLWLTIVVAAFFGLVSLIIFSGWFVLGLVVLALIMWVRSIFKDIHLEEKDEFE